MLSINLHDINTSNIIINDPINNSIIPNSKYYKILYSDENITLNSLYFHINLKSSYFDNIDNKIYINKESNNELIEKIKDIELEILNKIHKINKDKKKFNLKLYQLISSEFIKYQYVDTKNYKNKNINNNNQLNDVILKISGIWESDNSYGVTFKFLFPKTFLLLN